MVSCSISRRLRPRRVEPLCCQGPAQGDRWAIWIAEPIARKFIVTGGRCGRENLSSGRDGVGQRLRLLDTVCAQLGLPAPTSTTVAAMARLDGLCTGEVVAVERRVRFSPVTTADALVAVLGEEMGARRGRRGQIGFGA